MNFKEAKETLINHPKDGLYIYHCHFESGNEWHFLYIQEGAFRSQAIFQIYEEFLSYFESDTFWSLENCNVDGVFDGEEYFIVFKKENNIKELHLDNPEYSECSDIHEFISLIKQIKEKQQEQK